MSNALGADFLLEDLGDLVDQVISIDMQIERIMNEGKISELEEKKKLLKSKIERNMGDESTKVIEGKLGKAVWVTQNRKTVDTDVLYKKYSIPESEITACTKINPVKFIKISKK